MEKMTITQFGTDSYGAQLSLSCDLIEKTIVFRLLTMFNGRRNIEEFTDFEVAVDAYNAYEAGTKLTEYGESLKEAFYTKCKEFVAENPELFPDLDTTKRFPICGFHAITKDAKDVAGTYLNDLGFTVCPLLILPDYINKAQHSEDIICFRWEGGVKVTYKEVVAELEKCFVQEAVSNE